MVSGRLRRLSTKEAILQIGKKMKRTILQPARKRLQATWQQIKIQVRKVCSPPGLGGEHTFVKFLDVVASFQPNFIGVGR